MLYSYDIFDTCISRLYAYPRDLFLDLGYRLSPADLPEHRRLRAARDFQRRRVLAEKIAYLRSGERRTATIDDVYRNFRTPAWLGLGVEAIKQLELDLEREAIYGIPSIAREIDSLLSRGSRVVFMSDMYLDSRFIAEVLQSRGIATTGVKIYVSSEALATKASGRLYRSVLEAEAVAPHAAQHVGDNLRVDVVQARAAGVTARHFADSSLNDHEQRMVGAARRRTPNQSRLAGLARKWRLHDSGCGLADSTREAVAYGTIIPFLLSYVLWVLRDAQRRKIRRLYFVARDGQILHALAQELALLFPEVELRYLHGSRRAWIPASIMPGDESWKAIVFMGGEPNKPSDVLARIGVGGGAIEELRTLLALPDSDWQRDMSEPEALKFCDRLLSIPSAGDLVHSLAAGLRANVIGYMREQGLLDGTSWALVDLGWAFNCQAALNRILTRGAGRADPIQGYYVGAGSRYLPSNITGQTFCWVAEPGSILARRRVVIEHAFTPASHPTTTGYQAGPGRSTTPSFGQDSRSEDEVDYAIRLQQMARHAARDYVGDPRTRSIIEDATREVLRNVERLLTRPTVTEASAFADFGTMADLRHERRLLRPLCRPMSVGEVARIAFAVVRGRPDRAGTPMWLEGSAALSSKAARSAVNWMLALDAMQRRLRRRPR